MTAPAIVWLRDDLRIADNPALYAAAESGAPVLPVYIMDDAAAGDWRFGSARRWWMHHSLTSFGADLKQLGATLVLKQGDAATILHDLVARTKAEKVFWNRRYTPFGIEQDRAIKAALKERGVAVESFNACLAFEPWEIAQKSGEPFKVFTPYSRVWFDRGPPPEPWPAPKTLKGAEGVDGDRLESWGLLPTKPDWSGGMREAWRPGEADAWRRADAFLNGPVDGYGENRNLPSLEGTSRLSPHLHHGEIGPRQLFHAAKGLKGEKSVGKGGTHDWIRQLCWRDFSHHTLFYRPEFPDEPLRPEFGKFPWEDDAERFKAWTRGQTGYPIVDAGMRELWTTGYMHNRLRMIVGSFLTKDLMIPWQRGAHWFWDCLCDADLGNNSMGWQWVGGCGIDAAPYFRVFNPVTQGEKFDRDGGYIRRWVPELAKLPAKLIHKPHEVPEDTLRAAGIELGKTYPRPIVDHKVAREKALEAFYGLRRAA